jgi:hypothetical protein
MRKPGTLLFRIGRDPGVASHGKLARQVGKVHFQAGKFCRLVVRRDKALPSF